MLLLGSPLAHVRVPLPSARKECQYFGKECQYFGNNNILNGHIFPWPRLLVTKPYLLTQRAVIFKFQVISRELIKPYAICTKVVLEYKFLDASFRREA